MLSEAGVTGLPARPGNAAARDCGNGLRTQPVALRSQLDAANFAVPVVRVANNGIGLTDTELVRRHSVVVAAVCLLIRILVRSITMVTTSRSPGPHQIRARNSASLRRFRP